MKQNFILFFKLSLTIFISIMVSLYLFETYLNLFEKKLSFRKIQNEYLIKTGKNYDIRSKWEIYNDLRKNDKNISINISPIRHLNKKNIKIFPLSGISNIETIHCNENGYYSIYKSDRYGFNNPDKEWDSDIIEYLLVGDSFAHGACVNRPNDIASVLRNLSNKSVLNLGYTANGPLIQYATLKEYLSSKIKKIVWIYYAGNDLSDLKIEHKNFILSKYLNDDNFFQDLKSKQNDIDKINNKTLKNQANSYLNNLKKDSQIKYKILKFIRLNKTKDKVRKIFSKKEYQVVKDDVFFEILKKAKQLAKNNNSKFYFVYLPDFNRYQDENYSFEEEEKITQLVKKLDIPMINIHELLFKNKDKLEFYPFRIYRHYTVEGYEEVSRTIYNYTQD